MSNSDRQELKQATKPDLISRSALIAEYDRVHTGPPGGARKLMEEAPAVDAVEVVRCKDCKNYGWEQIPCHGRIERFCKLHKGLVIVTRDSYCSYGERK